MVKRLGKGINALIPEFPQDFELLNQVAEIEISKINSNPHQPRKEFNTQAMDELKQSIRENGIIQPITVRQVTDGFELISGERRLRACRELSLKSIPAYVLSVNTDVELMELSLIENLQREDLNPVEEAEAFYWLSNTCNLSHEEIAKKVGKERSTITNSIRLLNLPNEILHDLKEQKLTAGHARPILAISNEAQQINLWQRVKRDSLSVRAVEALVKKITVLPHLKQPTKKQLQQNMHKALEDHLMHIVGSRVKIKGADQGFIEIEFYSKEDLTRLIELFEIIEEKSD
jgi:ParB family chromosome partitioning protein